eukprot:9241621-Pyramimonas_sp.AAC.1
MVICLFFVYCGGGQKTLEDARAQLVDQDGDPLPPNPKAEKLAADTEVHLQALEVGPHRSNSRAQHGR